MRRLLPLGLLALTLFAGLLAASPAVALGLDPAFSQPPLGPAKAKGVVVWSHGRSINGDDWKSPTPVYLEALRNDGWDILRFDRLSRGDTLGDSSQRLAEYSTGLKHQGYRQVVLAGQSFGGFLALMAADASVDVDAVIATAPAAYGDFADFYDSWRLNATKLYPLLAQVKRARVMVFYFHDDDFDPGGRGEHSREILERHGLGFAVIDQPAFLTTHWAASTGLFMRRFAGCIRNFADDAKLSGELVCQPRWGTRPSAELKLPPDLADPGSVHPVAATAGVGSGAGDAPQTLRKVWYGFYPNGREVLLGVEAVHGDAVSALYAIGPSVDDKHPATWTRRNGHIAGRGFVFEGRGMSTLRFRPTQDGGLAATWMSADGETSMEAHLQSIDPRLLVERRTAGLSAPVAAATAHGDSDQAQR
jgi:pimeloyl-ACP methyl ester carboxylesterase